LRASRNIASSISIFVRLQEKESDRHEQLIAALPFCGEPYGRIGVNKLLNS
jgi:hypothetical protein